MSEHIIIEKENGIAVLTISREEALNALNGQLVDELVVKNDL